MDRVMNCQPECLVPQQWDMKPEARFKLWLDQLKLKNCRMDCSDMKSTTKAVCNWCWPDVVLKRLSTVALVVQTSKANFTIVNVWNQLLKQSAIGANQMGRQINFDVLTFTAVCWLREGDLIKVVFYWGYSKLLISILNSAWGRLASWPVKFCIKIRIPT